MQKLKFASYIVLTLVAIISGVVIAQTVQIDVDQDLMHAIDETVKDVNSNISLKDSKAAIAHAKELQDYFQQVETVFKEHGNVDDGVDLAVKAQQAAVELGKSASANDFDAAQAHAKDLSSTCKSCHDVYKST
ncbi:MAG: cytochrome c [Steroidobacter sp.]